jgi:phosphonoacetate hydrolase
LAATASEAAILLTADHGMNFKSRCWDLEKALQKRDAPVRIAISPERDKYLAHHQGTGGTAWVHLHGLEHEARVAALLGELEGVERVFTRAEAAKEFNLMANRLGDLVVIGDRDTVFGNLETEVEMLPTDFRTHGSLHEMNVPMVLHNVRTAPHNLDLARWMYTS